MPEKLLVVILGPTAVGKTASAITVAGEFGTEIISADSRQFFKGMSIGTAQPSSGELKQVRHHFIDCLHPTEEYNVGMFEREALPVLKDIFNRKNVAVMAGGSGLYIKAVCEGFDEVPQADKEIRTNLVELYKREGIQYLQDTLKKLDPVHFRNMDIKNPHRLIRGIEVCMLTGKPYSDARKGAKKKRGFSILKIGLNMDREKLYQRINERVDAMMAAGLLDEVRSLEPFRKKNANALQTVGYKELFDHLEGKTTLQEAVELIKQNSRNFAKRQLTWFRKDKEITWFKPEQLVEIIACIREKTG